ncbi:MAG: ATP-binding cassette domain-containing protein [Atopostipes suicloacalis]|nr:ATP-binding cassette domain-containing protein [Atopostipes suicloacalis]
MIQLDNVSKKYESFTAVQSVSLKIPPGEIHGVIGASGAGKSTLLRMMNFLERPDEGEVHINEESLNNLPKKQLRQMRQSLAMIFQGHHLIKNKTVFDNVIVALEIANTPKANRSDRVMEALSFVGLERLKNQYPSQLSGGEKQRVAIARAIVNQPRVLLCDEPTSSLDSNTTAEVLEVLNRINEEFNVTIVMVSHEMKVIKSICERVTVMDVGRVYDTINIEPTGVERMKKDAEGFVEWFQSRGDIYSA